MLSSPLPFSFGAGSNPPPGGQLPSDGQSEESGPSRRLPTILMIDDSPQDHELVEAACREAGIKAQLRFVSGAAEAAAYFEGRPPFGDRTKNPLPDLVLLDVQMPDKDGFEVLTWLRSRGGDWRVTPVVMLSTSRRPEEISRAYDLGANSYLVKPSGFDELCRALSDTAKYWLGRGRPS